MKTKATAQLSFRKVIARKIASLHYVGLPGQDPQEALLGRAPFLLSAHQGGRSGTNCRLVDRNHSSEKWRPFPPGQFNRQVAASHSPEPSNL